MHMQTYMRIYICTRRQSTQTQTQTQTQKQKHEQTPAFYKAQGPRRHHPYMQTNIHTANKRKTQDTQKLTSLPSAGPRGQMVWTTRTPVSLGNVWRKSSSVCGRMPSRRTSSYVSCLWGGREEGRKGGREE